VLARMKINLTMETNPTKVKKKIGHFELDGYRNVKRKRCSQNMPFFIGDIRYPICDDCNFLNKPINTAGNRNPETLIEFRRYDGK